MSWIDRLAESAYTSPSGVRMVFDYEDVSKSVDKKTAVFDFPDADGSYVQDLGRRGWQIPLRHIFWGANCDLAANAFELLLLEKGLGKLEHPLYGTIDVVPTGTIGRRDDLKTAANQAIIEVTYFESIGLIYPSSQIDPGAAVQAAVEAYNAAMADELEKSASLKTVSEKIGFKNEYLNYLKSARASLRSVASAQQDVQQQFDGIYSSIQLGIDTLIGDPLTLAFQTVRMIQAPAHAATLISDRLRAYSDLAGSIVASAIATPSGLDRRAQNSFYTRDLFLTAHVSGAVLSVVDNQFDTKVDALAAAATVLDLFDSAKAWRDQSYASLGEIDTGEVYQQLQKSVALTAGYLVALSFSLKQERRIVLDRARTCIDLVGELYGSIDDKLDFFINSNGLSGSEILELPRGRSIVYYV